MTQTDNADNELKSEQLEVEGNAQPAALPGQKKGTLYFFTGLSGAGKTTIGSLFYARHKLRNPATFLMDNDQVKHVFKRETLDYSTPSRIFRGRQLFLLSKELTDQGIDVVNCSIAMYNELREWNRAHFENYKEIYIKASMETLYKRDQKGLYSTGVQVVGVDLPYDEPENPDFTVDNNGQETPEAIVERIEKTFGLA